MRETAEHEARLPGAPGRLAPALNRGAHFPMAVIVLQLESGMSQ